MVANYSPVLPAFLCILDSISSGVEYHGYGGMTGGEEDNIILHMDSYDDYFSYSSLAEVLTRGRKRIFLLTVR